MSVTMDLTVTLDFACCSCEEPVRVTVQCRGGCPKSSLPGELASVRVPCPSCGSVNLLSFEPSGVVHSVRPGVAFRPLPEPSIN
jgi:hypothetical protein